MSAGTKDMRKWGYISLFSFFVGIMIGVLDYLYSGKYFVLMIIMSFAALSASIGMFRDEYKRLSKYLSVLLISAASFSLYLTTSHVFYAVIALAFILLFIAEDLRSVRKERSLG